MSFFSEFQSIRDQVQDDLLDSFFIRNYLREEGLSLICIVNIFEVDNKINTLFAGFVTLNADDLLNGILDVELFQILSELPSFKLSII